MTDEIALAKALGRAAQAQRLLDDELLQEAFAALDRDYTKAWRETAARDCAWLPLIPLIPLIAVATRASTA